VYLLRLKTLIIITLGIGVFFFFLFAQELNRRWHYQREVRRLEQGVQELERNTVALQHLNQYFNTNEYQERLAREKLNFKAPDEKVVLIPQNPAGKPSAAPAATQPAEPVLIPLAWWRAFFR
jgi:hypothetical protein